jgi:hypothetical protein
MAYQSLTIEFDHSPSPRFKFALEEARKHLSFHQEGKTYSVTFSRQGIDSIHRLIECLLNFRNKRIYIDGQEKPWQEVFNYFWCYHLRKKAYNPAQYCHGDSRQFPAFNLWGCIQAKMPMGDNEEWLRYGGMDSDKKTFIFNKKQIGHYLKSNTDDFQFCPALNLERMIQILESFPESVNPSIDKDWKYIGQSIKSLFVGIGLRDTEEFEICGVCPASTKAIENIQKKILEKIDK